MGKMSWRNDNGEEALVSTPSLKMWSKDRRLKNRTEKEVDMFHKTILFKFGHFHGYSYFLTRFFGHCIQTRVQ
jgi:hypothetical protein